MKEFKVVGTCIPSKHYMVDINGKIAQIKKLVDKGSYFTINRARQYGKTTTLVALETELKNKYITVLMSFGEFSDKSFMSEDRFCVSFIKHISNYMNLQSAEKEYAEKWRKDNITDFELLSEHITEMCRGRKVVLMIDEVDKTSDNRIFINFLMMLREKFLLRERDIGYTFHSVILAGVYDIKNIKLKMINEGIITPTATETKKYNSPWNIAVDFEVDMSFSPADIATMLKEYETDHNTGMDIDEIAREIYDYTSGYPFLVSRICQHIDVKLGKDWTIEGVQKAVKIMLSESNTLFDDMFKNVQSYKDLHDFLYALIFLGEERNYNIDQPEVNLGSMLGFIRNDGGKAAVANKIFELRLSNYFSDTTKISNKPSNIVKYDVVKNGRFDMALCFSKFAEYYAEIYNETDTAFLERHGRLLFLAYLRPLINGEGFYHIESAFTDLRRMDIVVDYGKEQFIIELKIWHGTQLHEEAYKQLSGYLDKKKAKTGYLITFDFRKESNKERKAEWVPVDGKQIFDVIV